MSGIRPLGRWIGVLMIGTTLPIATHARTQESHPVEVMVLGTVHMSNPGADRHDVQVDNVLGTRRQAELEAIANALARFRPTRIVVERQAEGPSFEAPVIHGRFSRQRNYSSRFSR